MPTQEEFQKGLELDRATVGYDPKTKCVPHFNRVIQCVREKRSTEDCEIYHNLFRGCTLVAAFDTDEKLDLPFFASTLINNKGLTNNKSSSTKEA